MKFDAHIVHDLKSPLAAIEGYAHLLIDGTGGDLSEKQQSYAAAIVSSSRTLLYIIELMKFAARLDGPFDDGKRESLIDNSTIHIDEMVCKVARMLRRSFETKSVVIEPVGASVVIARGGFLLETLAASLLIASLHTVARASTIRLEAAIERETIRIQLDAEGADPLHGPADVLTLAARIAESLSGTHSFENSRYRLELPLAAFSA